eukprot:3282045-Prymnesium_polylepis.1
MSECRTDVPTKRRPRSLEVAPARRAARRTAVAVRPVRPARAGEARWLQQKSEPQRTSHTTQTTRRLPKRRHAHGKAS